jgi:hypothetical protein
MILSQAEMSDAAAVWVDEKLIHTPHASIGGPDPGTAAHGQLTRGDRPDLFIHNALGRHYIGPQQGETGILGMVGKIRVHEFGLVKGLQSQELIHCAVQENDLGSSAADQNCGHQPLDAGGLLLLHHDVRDLLRSRIQDDVG